MRSIVTYHLIENCVAELEELCFMSKKEKLESRDSKKSKETRHQSLDHSRDLLSIVR